MTVAAEPSRTKTNVSRSQRRPWGRLRAQLLGVASAFGILFGALAFPAAAQAADFQHWITGGNDPYLDIGGAAATVSVEVKAIHPGPGPKPITVSAVLSGLDGLATVDVVSGSSGGACYRVGAGVAQCDAVMPNQSVQLQFSVAPVPESDLPEGETKKGELKINGGGASSGEQKTSVTVAGHASASVTDITGTITSNAEPVSGAKVVLTDGEGNDHETTTNDKGEFAFHGNEGTGIAPGEMTLKVTKEGFEDIEETIDVAAQTSFQQNFTMIQVETEPTATAEPEPTEAATSAAPEPSEEPEEGGVSGTLMVLIIVGGLLVIGGIVGIVFLLRGGKKDDPVDDDESFAKAPPEHQPTAAQVGSPGVYQAGPAPGQDAPTMIHNGPLVQDNEVGAYGAPTSAFGPAYGPGSDSTQVMPQAGMPASPPPPAVGPDGTQLLPRVKGPDKSGPLPPAPGSDATQVMPQASPRAPQSSFSDPGSTQPYPSPTPPPAPPTGRQTGASAFEAPPHPASGSQPPVSRDPYAPHQSQPPYQSQPPQPAADPYPSHGMSRDPYAPPSQPPSGPPAEPYTPSPTQAMPQGGHAEPPYGSHSQNPPPPASPYAADQPEGEGSPNSRRRDDEERRGWGEWDDRPRSW